MMPQAHKHVPRDHNCPCSDCMTMRLTYALLVARNRGNINETDYEKGVLILTTFLGGESL